MDGKEKILEQLTPLERKLLPYLEQESSARELEKVSSLKDVEVLRALQWLSNKGLVTMTRIEKNLISLDSNGKQYIEKGMPERRFLKSLNERAKTMEQILGEGFTMEELNICIGLLKRKGAIQIGRMVSGLIFNLASEGKKMLERPLPEEEFLKKEFPIEENSLDAEDKKLLAELLMRKGIVMRQKRIDFLAKITEQGKEALEAIGKSSSVYAEKLTPKMIQEGLWKDVRFRTYDVSANVPKIYGGRKHPLNALLDMIREVFLEMGFEEMKGQWVESSFWCFDSMWVPQDHPARDVQDTFFLPYEGKLPSKELVDKVAHVHEDGAKSGSKGYGYKWNPEIAKQLVMRTHTTAVSFRQLAKKETAEKKNAKYFCIGRIFRNEAVDATHLAEFHQVEGFVIGEDLSLKHLMGLIKEFYAKMGIHKIKFKVTYNPYTEPSLEALYYDDKRGKWLELINSGIFRPESVAPYGIKGNVLAWGLGVERLGMILYELDKLKDIIGDSCDIEWLRNHKATIRKD